jgi:2,4-dienoyl-CoA reductase-like NADH-dependent reductase (Old Yellow Enzyme family)
MACELPYRWGFGVDAADPTRFDLDEPFRLVRLLQAAGVTLVNVTLGSPYANPHLQRPAAYPPSDGYDPPDDPLHCVRAHLECVRQLKAGFPSLRLVGTGYTYLQDWLPHAAAHQLAAGHVDFVGLGRMLLTYPELPRDLLAGRAADRRRICRTFSDCTTAPRNGMPSGCYPLDPFYQARPEAARVKALNQERRL